VIDLTYLLAPTTPQPRQAIFPCIAEGSARYIGCVGVERCRDVLGTATCVLGRWSGSPPMPKPVKPRLPRKPKPVPLVEPPDVGEPRDRRRRFAPREDNDRNVRPL
jgi:hypothetical protein